MYFADYYNKIPLGIVSKRITGAGVTSFALENDIPTIVVVPTVALITNKVAQYPNDRRSENVIGLYGDTSVSKIAAYVKSTIVPKIMVTYDSFWKLSDIIQPDWHIIIDEMQLLLTAYNYRSDAINRLLVSLSNYSNVSFISATPIKPEYLPPSMVGLPYTELQWSYITPVVVYPTQYKKPLTAIYNIIKKYRLGLMEINKHKSEAGYFFLNSVTTIAHVIKKAGLLPSEVRIICSETDENKKKLGKNYKIETALHPEKLINFVTSSSFEGVDFYSKSGIAFVISMNSSKYTLLSLDTSIYQIAGRIRTISNPFRGSIFHIFNENPLKLTEEQFESIVEDKIRATNEYLVDFNTASVAHKKDIIKDVTGLDSNYLYEFTPNNLGFDHLKHNSDLHTWECVIKPYQSGLYVINKYKESENFEVKGDLTITENKGKFISPTDFESVCEMLYKGYGDLTKARLQFSLLDEAVDVLGLDGMRKLGYKPTRIRAALHLKTKEADIVKELRKSLPKGQYIVPDIKTIMQTVYDNNGVTKAVKASDIETIFGIKASNKLINGKSTRIYNIP